MDSRLKIKSIIVAIILILLIVTIVAGYNIYSYANQIKREQEKETTDYNRELSESGPGNLPLRDYTVSVGLQPERDDVDYSAFERDETFFDKELSEYEQMMAAKSKKLSMVATSVDKDLRVSVYNASGKLLTEEELFIKVDGDEYKDLDKDGIIYVPELKAGIHEVVLQPIGEYQVPKSPLQVKVKANIEYVPIDDISLLIKTEADIVPEEEDTETFDLTDADETQMTGKWDSLGNESFGIDVSKWNKEIDWQAAHNAGVQFAIIRCGYRGSKTGALVQDPYFLDNLNNARAAGVDVGLYFFTQAVNEIEAVEEASMVLSLNRGRLDYPIFIDTEGAGGNGRADGLDMATRTNVCKAFCETIVGAGYDAGIYASKNWFNNKLYMSELESNYCIWLAEYKDSPTYASKYNLWQYTSSGYIDGIDGRVDFDIAYPKLNKEADDTKTVE